MQTKPKEFDELQDDDYTIPKGRKKIAQIGNMTYTISAKSDIDLTHEDYLRINKKGGKFRSKKEWD